MADSVSPQILKHLARYSDRTPCLLINPSPETTECVREEYMELDGGVLSMTPRGWDTLRAYREALSNG